MARGHSYLWAPSLVVPELVANAAIALATAAIAVVLLRAAARAPAGGARVADALPPSDGPFRGVPMLLKDLDAALAGVPLTAATRLLADYRPVRDATIVERFRRAGTVIFGKSNLPELGITPFTESKLFGP